MDIIRIKKIQLFLLKSLHLTGVYH